MYMVSIFARLFTVNRVVIAASRAEAAAMVDQTGAIAVWVEEAFYDDEEEEFGLYAKLH